ncbi:helix-turn-helix domain-containing protein [Bacillus infantis]|uniref:helix-turn-helix domain-containing protein n=1 Tax=Bacillus infantis TaxID=324767 RepID=UPI003CF2C777
MNNIGNRIKQKREEYGWTQEELARRMGYKSKSTINKIEMGKNDVVQSNVVKFAEVLNTTPAYLMGWDQEQIDAIDEIKESKNAYNDGIEALMVEFAEMHFTPTDIAQIRMFMHSMKEQEVKIDLGAAIREARESKGMTKEQLAEQLEVPVEMIDLYEGSMSFPYEQMKKLNSILGISFYTMLGIPQEDASLYEKIYFLHLDEDEMKDVYNYAEYVKSKRK